MLIKITNEQLDRIGRELERVANLGAYGKEENYGTWEAVGKWHGIKFVLDELKIKI